MRTMHILESYVNNVFGSSMWSCLTNIITDEREEEEEEDVYDLAMCYVDHLKTWLELP